MHCTEETVCKKKRDQEMLEIVKRLMKQLAQKSCCEKTLLIIKIQCPPVSKMKGKYCRAGYNINNVHILYWERGTDIYYLKGV